MSGSREESRGSPDSDHERTVRRIRRSFLRGLADRLATLRRSLDEIHPGPADGDPVRTLWREAHNLAGTASSLGFPDLSGAARSLEGLAERWSEAEEVPEEGRATARRHVAVLEERCRELLERPEGEEPG